MSTIKEALKTLPELRTHTEKQQAYIAGIYAQKTICLSCREQAAHSIIECYPEGWWDNEDFPKVLRCPTTKEQVEIVVPLIGQSFLARFKGRK